MRFYRISGIGILYEKSESQTVQSAILLDRLFLAMKKRCEQFLRLKHRFIVVVEKVRVCERERGISWLHGSVWRLAERWNVMWNQNKHVIPSVKVHRLILMVSGSQYWILNDCKQYLSGAGISSLKIISFIEHLVMCIA